MSHTTRSGRHRAANRYSPVAELSSIMKSAGGTGVRASAVLAASGGLVATFALPAQALPSSRSAASQSSGATAPADVLGSSHAKLAAPAVTAPEVTAPVAAEAVGVAGVKAVAKPKPKPEPVAEVVAQAVETRSTDTTASRSEAAPPPPPSVNVPQTSSGIVGIAQQYIGTPYVYGGASPAGFDCSGFTQYVFGRAGISLPRTAAQQYAAATPVSNPQPGDLVFFGSPVWHVGIYAGNGMMIDSPKPGTTVQYRPLFSGVTGYGRF